VSPKDGILKKAYIKYCSSKLDKPIFLGIKSNENRGTDKLSFAFIVPPKENQKPADIYFGKKSIRKIKFSRIIKKEIVYLCLYVWNEHLYVLMAQLVEALLYKSEDHGFDSK
jgi:hypothetical protein